MPYFKNKILGTAAVLTMSISAAHAADDFTSHHIVDGKQYESYAEQLPAEEKLELREYFQYEEREPCQNYQPVPEGFMRSHCNLYREEPRQYTQTESRTIRWNDGQEENARFTNVVNDYELHFPYDSAAIEPAAGDTLDQVAREIEKYNPRDVTISGHADKAGPSDYNVKLSQERAEAVSMALSRRGVESRIIDKEAYGESRPAIPTKDGVALRENRRVVVEFHK